MIYGGISYTDLPIRQIAYPNTGYNRSGRGADDRYVSIAYLAGGAGTERNEQFIRIHTQCGFQIRRKER